MAIDIKNYVDISTQFPNAGVAGRSFGGMVFTAAAMTDPGATDALHAVYEEFMDARKTVVVELSLDEVKVLFGESSVEYKFAKGYYGYISPSGRFASSLQFTRVNTGTDPVQAFQNVNALTNQFGSFTFLSLPDSGESSASETVSCAELLDVAKENAKLDAKYLFVVNDLYNGSNIETIVGTDAFQFKDISGVCFVAGGTAASAFMPMALFAATDYNGGQVTNFMFKQFGTDETMTVTDDTTYRAFNTAVAPVNFYGLTQTNGQTFAFFQRGFNTNGVETSVYCNEVWFKSICETAILNLLLERERLDASPLGVDLVKLTVIDCCSGGISNGMFMAKTPSDLDKRDIREIVTRAGGTSAEVDSIFVDVATKGYAVYAHLIQSTDNLNGRLGNTKEKYIAYYVFYGTADSVRYVKGVDILLK